MGAITGDNRFEKVMNENAGKGRRQNNMCEVLDRIEARGIERGMAQGMAQGRLDNARKTSINLSLMGVDNVFISKAVETPIETIELWISEWKNGTHSEP